MWYRGILSKSDDMAMEVDKVVLLFAMKNENSLSYFKIISFCHEDTALARRMSSHCLK